jgi:hypothetical protein
MVHSVTLSCPALVAMVTVAFQQGAGDVVGDALALVEVKWSIVGAVPTQYGHGLAYFQRGLY